ncbi:MAG: hypothetical protein JSS43_13725 [Proteobacteria bacterium]|nr:hypothetical protein [Pseudomonadota bacterium]
MTRPARTGRRSAAPAPQGVAGIRLLVGTPAYGGMVHLEYVRSLFEFARAGLQFEMATIGNESLITRARNAIISNFYSRPEYTHLLFLDADVRLLAADLLRMVQSNVPVLGAPVALKSFDEQGNRIWNLGRTLGAKGSLIKVEMVGTAVLLLSRAACIALVEDAIAHGRVYERGSFLQGDPGAAVHYDVFQVGVHDGVYLSEDFWACRRLHSLGFDVLIDPTVVTTHHGVMAV